MRKSTKASSQKKSSVVKKPKIIAGDVKRRKKPEYKSFRLHKKVKRPELKLPSWWQITKKAFLLMKANAKPISWFVLIYGLLYLVFVRGVVSPVDIDNIKEQISAVTGNEGSNLTANITIVGVLFESALSTGGEVAGLYQIIFLTLSTLALIWLFRQQQAGNKVSMKDAFYKGMYPLVPFVLVLAVIALQTLPATVGNFLYTTVNSQGLAVSTFEQVLWSLLLLTTILLSLYMISTSIVALFISTLPEMTPLKSLDKAKELITFRRANVMGKIIVLMLVSGVLFIGFMLPAIYISSLVAQIVLFLLTVLVVPFSVAYMFVLYRELLE